MEKTSDEFYKKNYTISTKKPYDFVLKLAEHLRSHGKLVISKNIIMATGPRKEAEVNFYLIRKLDRFSKLFFLFKTNSQITLGRLHISIVGMNQIQIPVGGIVGLEFQKWYLSEIHPKINEKSNKIIEEITKDIEDSIEKWENEEAQKTK